MIDKLVQLQYIGSDEYFKEIKKYQEEYGY